LSDALLLLEPLWPHLVLLAHLAAAAACSVHVTLQKRDPRAAIGWLALVWFSPLLGSAGHVLFGINRIRRRARLLRAGAPPRAAVPEGPDAGGAALGALEGLARAIGRSTARPLLDGNAVTPLWDGDEAYPAMLDAIGQARVSIALCSYIFDDDRAGQQFIEALAAAAARSVQVRVLIDGAGARYSRRPVARLLRRAGVPAALFLPPSAPWRIRFFNLRNHRKLLVVDGRVAFTGGMNIRQGHAASLASPTDRVADVHFALTGPVVAQLQAVFVDDWCFATGEALGGEDWFPPSAAEPAKGCPARVISDGPDEDYERFLDAVFAALACARSEVSIATPYFLPEESLLRALGTAAARGVSVRIVLPARPNVLLVQWASGPAVEAAVRRGCKVFLAPAPFSHTKLVVVDRAWTLFGSANWDPRSTELNFELNVEAYDAGLAETCSAALERAMRPEHEVTIRALAARGLGLRLRDGLARLATPYL
jgi:cardiolipin synthase